MDLASVKEAAALGAAVVTAASAFCAATPTPAPNTAWGRLYRGIEAAALLVGKAKQIGLVPPASPAPLHEPGAPAVPFAPGAES